MIRTQVTLEKQAYRDAQKEAKRQGISLAEFMRRALALALARAERERQEHAGFQEKPWMRYSGCLDSGDPDSSQKIDEVVYGRDEP